MDPSKERRKLNVLEAFNGQYFFNLPTHKDQTSGANWWLFLNEGVYNEEWRAAV